MAVKGPSYMVMVLGTICLISLATFIFFSSPQKLTVGVKDHHLLRREGLQSKTLQQLALHVKQLEEAVAKYSGSKTGDEKGNEDPSAIDHMAAYKAPQHNANPSDQLKRSDQPVSSMVSVSIKDTLDDAVTSQWLSRLASKLLCMRLRSGGIYHYHTRKAAGTSIRDILTKIAATWHVRYYETEGIVLNREIIDKKTGLLTVTSLREPIARILSLYWYEHVGWYDGVLKQTERCKSLKEWVSAWRDGSPWKTQFMSKNPDSVYVEIDNYYVKMLTGWHPRNSRSRVNADDLEAAKAVLRSFDLVLLSDWMGDSTQVEAMNAVFPGRTSIGAGHKVKGDFNAKTRLMPTLAPDEAEIRQLLADINKYDIELYAYAQSLMAYRLKFIGPAVAGVKEELGLDSHLNTVVRGEVFNKHKGQCAALDAHFDPKFRKKYVGIFQPPGHKGPF